MSLLQSLYTHLSTHASTQPLVGTRVYPVILPQSPTYPSITYRKNGIDRDAGISGAQSSTVTMFVAVDSWGDTYTAAKSLSDAVITALQNIQGDMSGTTVSRVHVGDDFETYEQEVEAYRVSHQFLFAYDEG